MDLLSQKPENDHGLRFLPSRLQRMLFNNVSSWRTMIPSWWPAHYSRYNPNATIAKQPVTASPTAYMSGLRGLASLFVFIHHYPLDYFPHLHRGYLATSEDTSLLQLPFVRIIYSGRFMVAIFFVLSGYVLSYKPIQLARSGNRAALLETLASSVFRRFMRLFLPILLSSFFAMISCHYSWYGSLNLHIRVPPSIPFLAQLGTWFEDISKLMDPFTWTVYMPKYAGQLWTLPTEFRGSMLVFLCILGLCRVRSTVRMTFLAAFAIYCFWTRMHWDMFLFLSGTILAEAQTIQHELPFRWYVADPDRGKLMRAAMRIFWVVTFALSLFLACWPDYNSDSSPGYVVLSNVTPASYGGGDGRTKFWTCISAAMMLLSLENLPVLQRPLNTAFAAYLGEISFSLYIVHVPICYTFGRWLTVTCIEKTGSTVTGFGLAALVVTPVVFWIADVYWRLVDAKAVEFARWTWMKCSIPKE
ncbi:MAG: hypothetical protein M1818_008487 [Claussenomyces sp. TS43310]|nr:MAG: hypothetical protein M1818_008487 [Claussenomyces sp. TS43310]